MKAFVSWSGGKDCTLALYSFLQEPANEVAYLLNLVDSASLGSVSRQLGDDLLMAQSEALEISLIRETVFFGNTYEFHLKKVISKLKEEGVQAGVFGDIYLQEHRDWIERVCGEMDITPVFPLWGRSAISILNEFTDKHFRAVIIAVKENGQLLPLLGKELDKELIGELRQIQGIDICGERGEYHTFVCDAPLFKKPIELAYGEAYTESGTVFLPIHLKQIR